MWACVLWIRIDFCGKNDNRSKTLFIRICRFCDSESGEYGDVLASTAWGLRRKAGGRVGYLKTQTALIANKQENAKVVSFAAPVAAPAMAFAA